MVIVEKIKRIKEKHLFWGYRRVRAFLRKKHGLLVGKKLIRRLMKEHDLDVQRKRYKAKRTPMRSKPRPERKNEWWGSDMTKFYVNTVGWVYLVVVLDWYTKQVVGYSLGLRPTTDLWLEALHMGVANACPLGSRSYAINLMTDNGSQPTSKKYESVIEDLGINHVTTSYSNPKGNADTERWCRTFKEEVIWPQEFYSWEESASEVHQFVKFYNEEYPHSTLNHMSPNEFDKQLDQAQAA